MNDKNVVMRMHLFLGAFRSEGELNVNLVSEYVNELENQMLKEDGKGGRRSLLINGVSVINALLYARGKRL